MLLHAIWSGITLLFESRPKKKLRREILSYYKSIPAQDIDPHKKEALEFLSDHKLHVFPHNFIKKYKRNRVAVHTDEATGLKYVLHDGKRLYFKRNWSARKIRRNYNFLLLEQDPLSPHRYLTDHFTVNHGDVVVDAGAAEGNFALSIIDKAEKLYLFETDTEWIEALEATFKPWRNKVEIINRFVSNFNDEEHVSLDQFLQKKSRVDFIKADIEGAESDFLQGSSSILSANKNLKIAITTYHKQKDEVELNVVLQKYGFSTSFTNGYMLFPHYEPLKPPYFRRGLLRATKQSQ
mgnify:FL=1